MASKKKPAAKKKSPAKPKRERLDFSQNALRIVREATERG